MFLVCTDKCGGERLGSVIRMAECFDSFSFIAPHLPSLSVYEVDRYKTHGFVISPLVLDMSLAN
jgi:hypothetical protein